MNEKQHHSECGILLSHAVADQLPAITGTQLKVYVSLCAMYRGDPFPATMDQIAEATGFSKRAVTDAIGILEQRNFITRLAGSGGQPNQYAITLAASPEAAATSNCVSPPEPTLTESAAAAANAIGMQETKQCTSTSAPKPQEVPSAAQPRQWTVSELVALRYRKVNEEELKEIRAAYPDEGDLWRRLARFDGVDRAMDLDFFIGAVRQFT